MILQRDLAGLSKGQRLHLLYKRGHHKMQALVEVVEPHIKRERRVKVRLLFQKGDGYVLGFDVGEIYYIDRVNLILVKEIPDLLEVASKT